MKKKIEIKCPCGKNVTYSKERDIWIHKDTGELCPKLNLYEPEIEKIEDPSNIYQIVTKKPSQEDIDIIMTIIRNILSEKIPKAKTEITYQQTIASLLIPLKIKTDFRIIDIKTLIVSTNISRILMKVFNVRIPTILKAREKAEKKIGLQKVIREIKKALAKKDERKISRLLELLKLLEKLQNIK